MSRGADTSRSTTLGATRGGAVSDARGSRGVRPGARAVRQRRGLEIQTGQVNLKEVGDEHAARLSWRQGGAIGPMVTSSAGQSQRVARYRRPALRPSTHPGD